MFAIGAGGGLLPTDWTLEAVGWFSRAPLLISRLSPSPSSSTPPGTLPAVATGSIAIPLFSMAAAAAAVAAGTAIAAIGRYSFRAWRRARARAGGDDDGASASRSLAEVYGYSASSGAGCNSDESALDASFLTSGD